MRATATDIAAISLREWTVVVALIFGGCCSNVVALEKIVQVNPSSGTLITFVQFVCVAIEGYINFYDASAGFPYLAKSHFPLTAWALPVLLFFAVSTLNNWAWAFDVSVPVHIVFRSGGTATTMLLGLLYGKRYTTKQFAGVSLLTAGVLCATLSDYFSKTTPSDADNVSQITFDAKFLGGIAVLSAGLVAGSLQGLVTESLYAAYGRHWKENLFYTHALSLVLFWPLLPQIKHQFGRLLHSSVMWDTPLGPVPDQLVYLALNCATQYLCIRGVHRLGGRLSALAVTVVLTLRKLASLFISIYLFGTRPPPGMLLGIALVSLGTFIYSRR